MDSMRLMDYGEKRKGLKRGAMFALSFSLECCLKVEDFVNCTSQFHSHNNFKTASSHEKRQITMSLEFQNELLVGYLIYRNHRALTSITKVRLQ